MRDIYRRKAKTYSTIVNNENNVVITLKYFKKYFQ